VPSRIERHRRRALGYGYSGEHFTETEWLELLEACGGRCLSCGTAEDLSADHIIPLSLGGANTIENIQVLCRDCNSLKADSVVDYRTTILVSAGG
jgi:5-methylcytosine-specific restriction endonuclease McrA